ncbi:DUF6049 family protein [Oerskovia enterophila]|uniref:DUF6049 family protein n=1 Tax=Oerskovia enterophila TaxID=43678 RepID=UPI00339912C0
MTFHSPVGSARASSRRPADSTAPSAVVQAPARPRPSSDDPRTGPRAAAPRSLTRNLVGGLLTAALTLALVVVPSSPGGAREAAATAEVGVSGVAAAEPAVVDEPGAVSTTLVSMTPTTVGPGSTVTVVARIHNGTDEALTAPRATLGVNWRLLGTRSALAAWADEPTSKRSAEAMATETLDPIAPGQDATVTFDLDTDDFNLEPGSGWGPRPLSITITDGSERLDVLRTFLLWEDTAAPSPVGLSLLAPVTGPALGLTTATDAQGQERTSVDVAAVDGALGADQRLGHLLAATADRPEVAWAVDPALVAAARTSAESSTSAWVSSFDEASADRSVFALRPYDPDPAAYAQVGAALPAPTVPLPGGSTTDPAWRTDLTLPGDEVPGRATVRTSVQAGSPLVVVRGDGLTPVDSVSYTPTGLATVETDAGPATALVSDAALTRAFTAGTQTSGTGSTTDATQRLLAETAVIASERPADSRHLLIALPRGFDPDPAAFDAVLDALDATSWVALTPVDDLLSAPVPDVERNALPEADGGEGVLPAPEMSSLQRARTEVSTFSTIATDPAAIIQEAEPALVVPTAVAYRTAPDERTAAVQAAVADADRLRSSVAVVRRGSGVLLINTSGNIPVRVQNTLDQEVTVQVALRPDNARLKVVSFPVGPIPPGTEVDFKVPVRAYGSGNVRVEVELLAVPSGTVVAPSSDFSVRVRADWETVGTAVFAGLVALLMIGGLWRTIRRGRSPRRVAELTPASGVPAAQASAPPSDTSAGSEE